MWCRPLLAHLTGQKEDNDDGGTVITAQKFNVGGSSWKFLSTLKSWEHYCCMCKYNRFSLCRIEQLFILFLFVCFFSYISFFWFAVVVEHFSDMCLCIFWDTYIYSNNQPYLGRGEEKNFCEISEAVGNGVLTHLVFLLLELKEKDVIVAGKTHETCCYLLNIPLLC